MNFANTGAQNGVFSYLSIASSSPSPLIAEVLKIAQVLFLRAESPRAVEISEGVNAPMSFRCGERRRERRAHAIHGHAIIFQSKYEISM